MTLLIMTYYLRSSWFIYIATNIMDLHFTVHSTVLHWTSPLQATCMHNLLCSNIFAEHLLRVNLLVRTKTANCSMCNHSVFESIRLTCAVMLEECQILFGTNMCCFYHSCSAAAKYLFFPDLRMLLVFLSSQFNMIEISIYRMMCSW